MKKSEINFDVISNFILHLTHCSNSQDNHWEEPIGEYTPKLLYEIAEEYIEEDHTDGEGNEENHIVTYGVESSYKYDDIKKEHPEYVVIVGDFGEGGSRTIGTINGIDNLEAVRDLVEFILNPIY